MCHWPLAVTTTLPLDTETSNSLSAWAAPAIVRIEVKTHRPSDASLTRICEPLPGAARRQTKSHTSCRARYLPPLVSPEWRWSERLPVVDELPGNGATLHFVDESGQPHFFDAPRDHVSPIREGDDLVPHLAVLRGRLDGPALGSFRIEEAST